MEYITLTKQDPEFESYLLGTFSTTHRALPIETYHAQTVRERVTFRVLPVSAVGLPAWWKIYFWSCRPELLGLTMGPSIAAWLSQRQWILEWTKWPSWCALVGIFFLHTAVFLLNDVHDHLHGLDRLNRRRGSQVIQKGWVSASSMRRWALVNMALAVLFGVPAFLNAPGALALICVSALFGLGLVIQNKMTRWGLCDLVLALVFGPLLTSGIALASFGATNRRELWLGLAFGSLSAWVFQARQLEHLFRSKPEGFRTFLGFFAFDQARTVLVIEGGILLLLQPLVALTLGVPLKVLLLLPVVSVPLVLFLLRVKQAASPLSSSLVNSERWALATHLSWSVWWILALGVPWL